MKYIYLRYLKISYKECYLLLLLIAFLCKQSYGEEPLPDNNRILRTGVIFTDKNTEDFSKKDSLLEISPPYWTPLEADVKLMESKLGTYIKRGKGKDAKIIAARINNYKKQYFGYYQDGEKWILINSFCSSFYNDSLIKKNMWHDTPIIVFDGGSCFFRVRYRVSDKTFHDLDVNK